MAKIADTGLIRAAKLLGGVDSVTPFTKIAVGTGTDAESAAHTALITEVGEQSCTPTYEATNKCVWTATITGFASSYSLAEVAVLSADECLLLRHLWSVVRGVDPGDSVTVTVKVTTGEAT
ncbi:hypothetical protein ACKUB1_13895 [Methanospirillum stamsii]|uniref:Uncharacterized protein n=1 Tax=Methanospirillum stamsii TaxID=1277351 RepID=A0A2V2NHJ8_9EURY|nr:hypothetical protein [Methanospirillum stamsii]PWR74803.1 hypothetical protein DLD82_07865 [Methanospirillum stamsii]